MECDDVERKVCFVVVMMTMLLLTMSAMVVVVPQEKAVNSGRFLLLSPKQLQSSDKEECFFRKPLSDKNSQKLPFKSKLKN